MVKIQSSVNVVITVALKQEFPIQWAQKLGYAVVTLKGLQSGQLGLKSMAQRQILIVITGVGKVASLDAARWIKTYLNPQFVINVGTAGSSLSELPVGSLITPAMVQTPDDTPIALDTRLPFPAHGHQSTQTTVEPLTTIEATGQNHDSASASFVDMEAYYQASEFQGSGISFHVIKWISDRNNHTTSIDHSSSLNRCRVVFKSLFWWLNRPYEKQSVSVVIPVYNRSALISRAIDSVLAQDCPPDEIIVVNDGSNDVTADKLADYGSSIHVIHLDSNQGVSTARNIGVERASSEWIAFLDSDDEWSTQKLEAQLAHIKQHPYLDILQSKELWIRHGHTLNQKKYHQKQSGWIWDISLDRCMISPSSVMIKKQLFNQYNGFNPSLRVCEDYDLWLRISRWHPVGLEDSISLIKYGGHSDQLSASSVMDQYRVTALMNALTQETDPEYQEPLREILEKKLTILIKGSQKRQLDTQTAFYQDLLTQVSTIG